MFWVQKEMLAWLTSLLRFRNKQSPYESYECLLYAKVISSFSVVRIFLDKEQIGLGFGEKGGEGFFFLSWILGYHI